MCTFDAPISRCEAMRCMVITDQTRRQCAWEHGCPPQMKCPLASCFTGVEIRPHGRVPHRARRLAAAAPAMPLP